MPLLLYRLVEYVARLEDGVRLRHLDVLQVPLVARREHAYVEVSPGQRCLVLGGEAEIQAGVPTQRGVAVARAVEDARAGVVGSCQVLPAVSSGRLLAFERGREVGLVCSVVGLRKVILPCFAFASFGSCTGT